MQIKTLAASAAASLLLAACAGPGGVTVHSSYIAADYSYSDFRYHNAGQPSYVEVHNNPFGGAGADERIAGLMTGNTQGVEIPFTADDRLSGNASKFVVYFDPPAGLNGKSACRLDADRNQVSASGSVSEVLVSYCIGGRDKAWVRASTKAVSDITDPSLSRLMAKATFDLLPVEFSKRQGGSGGGI